MVSNGKRRKIMDNNDMIQMLVEEAGRMATDLAMDGTPCRIHWVPPRSGTDPYYGFIISTPYTEELTGSLPPPWKEKR
jgi:hypothetical protein